MDRILYKDKVVEEFGDITEVGEDFIRTTDESRFGILDMENYTFPEGTNLPNPNLTFEERLEQLELIALTNEGVI